MSRQGPEKPAGKRSGFVYFVQCGDEVGRTRRGPIKIGSATDVGERLDRLQTGCPFALVLLASIRSDDVLNDEAELHARFRRQRIRGEWFAWTHELEELISSLPSVELGSALVDPSLPREFAWRGRRRRWTERQ